MKISTFVGTRFIVGQSAEENWSIIAAADRTYYWLHLDGCPSAHIIIEIDVEPTVEELEYASKLVREATPKAPQNAHSVWTRISNIKRGSRPGEVYFMNSKDVYIYKNNKN